MASKAQTKESRDDEFIVKWLSKYKLRTRQDYVKHIEDFRSATGLSLGEVTETDVTNYLDQMAKINTPPAALNAIRIVITALYKYAMSVGYVKVNPVPYIKPDRNPIQFEILTEKQVTRLLKSTTIHRDYLILNFMYYLAMSSEEITKVNVSHITRINNRLFLKIQGEFQRTLPIPDHLHSRLIPGRDLEIPLFLSRNMNALGVRQINRIVEAAGKAAKIPNLNPRMLRTSHAAHAIWHGATMQQVATALGLRLKSAAIYFTKFATPSTGDDRYTLDLLLKIRY